MRLLVLPGALLAVLLWRQGDLLARICGLVLIFDLLVHVAPWRLPRSNWSALKYWFEGLLYVVPMTLVGIGGVLLGAYWAVHTPGALWFLAGCALGCALVVLSRINLVGLYRGDLAFLAGPDRPSFVAARAASVIVAPFPEELFFRGAVLALPNVDPLVAVLSATAFVARHHLLRGVDRWKRDLVLVEVAGAIGFTALTVASHSVYPAMVAHVINNAPGAAVQLQRLRLSRANAE